ncbi:MAG: hypothetical protein LBD75_03285 [Candidatus Peribacteria bacterium]|jgi:Holliday junction resolvase|nr:hypothetical protein [Candidatus Peribacteria bacterium]
MTKEKNKERSYVKKEEIEQLLEHIEKTEKRKDIRMRNSLIIKVGFNN